MPTSSQSQILSVVDYQLLHQQQANGQDGTTKLPARITVNQISTDELKRQHRNEDHRTIARNKNGRDHHSPSSPTPDDRRRNSGKNADGLQSARSSQRSDILHMPVINLNTAGQNEPRTTSSVVNINDNRPTRTLNTYGQTKSTVLNPSIQSFQYRRNSLNSDNDELIETEHKLKQIKKYPTPISAEDNTTSTSDLDNTRDNGDENLNPEQSSGLLNDNARRLLILGTIRPSKTFYKHLPEADVNHLMEYFRKMKTTNQRMSSEELHEELSNKYVEYKPKIFFDSACVTKGQVTNIEKIVEQYAEKIRTHKAEFVKLENPMRFVIKSVDNDTPLTTIPREYNDCFITLITRSDPLRKSDLVSELVHDKFLQDVKANSLDISYFPGGVNYDVPRDDIDEHGQMNTETYEKLKKRLNNRKVWYFDNPPEKKPNALLAILPTDSSINIDHQRLYDALYDRLKTVSTDDNSNLTERILSIEFIPLSCILNSNDIPNQFIVDCDTKETKNQLMDKPLKISLNKQSAMIELRSYDEDMQREYEKFIKSEKYRELIKNHDNAVKRTTTKK